MSTRPLKIAILAMGGEGGGVLADWIVDLGESNGYIAQTTSVPGVAQRTGATIYYVELFPRQEARRAGASPVLALMPLPGDVDVVLASELMEAGRAVQRGLVTPDRTTLIASTHRVFAISEKSAMGDGRADASNLLAHGTAAARRFVRFDMAEVAERCGTVVSAVLFGALAGAGVLPFGRRAFEETIERGGVGVAASLKAFAIAFGRASGHTEDAPRAEAQPVGAPAQPKDARVGALLARVGNEFGQPVRGVLLEGLRRLLDYQDCAYAALYLDRMARVQRNAPADEPLLVETARHLALWMSYEDTIRVADLKTRATRFERVRSEVKAAERQLLAINEFMHPRVQEICETLPAALGRWLAGSGWPRRLVQRMACKGRVVKTTSLGGFLLLYVVAAIRRWRRGTLRYEIENARIEQWLRRVQTFAVSNAQLALEVVQCQRLVKGYGETHERGWRNFETVMAHLDDRGATLAPATLREWREAALADESGKKLRELLRPVSAAPLAEAAAA